MMRHEVHCEISPRVSHSREIDAVDVHT